MGGRPSKSDRNAIHDWVERVKEAPPGTTPSGVPDLPYPMVDSGKHRFVYELGNGAVLKLPKVAKGIGCNEREADLYRRAPKALRKHLCPVIAAGPGWIVMKKLETPVPRKRKYEKQVMRILELGLDFGVRISDIVHRRTGRPRRNNIRLHKGRVVLIDYANLYDADRSLLSACVRRFLAEQPPDGMETQGKRPPRK
ncbi:hypothetical protein [Paenibacillus sp.]|uniref:hypothetical protein n=1 Tax=Paenibacillus sp. TaxID=58172 RepID=UPI002D6DF8A6|nr:hypothetical protein [Paenibacillus sp.]HZG56837.1 hypothetical protein [Paenibacillus sp.]